MKNPCTQTCPRRSADCRLRCPDSKAWEDWKADLRKRYQREALLNDYISSAAAATRRRLHMKD